MAKIRQALTRVAEALGLNQTLLARAQRRYKANRKRAYKAHAQQLVAQKQADAARAKGDTATAARKDKAALRHGSVAFKNHSRAQHYLGSVKTLTQRIHGLETTHAAIAAKLKKLNHVQVRGNKVTGGKPRGQIRVALHTAAGNCAAGKQNNYYSQVGAASDYGHTITGMPYGHRFDCSSFADGIYYVCGLPDPSGTDYNGGYTGTEGERGREVSPGAAQTGDLILYGSFPHHHVEVVDDPAVRTTVGHGSGPIDGGIFDLFGDGDFHIRSYL